MLRACHAIVVELRPHHKDIEAFVRQVQRQQEDGYRMICCQQDGEVCAVAGFRVGECLAWGRFLYVDDLITCESGRGRGLGERLLLALRELGREAGCEQLVLDTALSNSLAQRFYFRAGLLARGLHFSMEL